MALLFFDAMQDLSNNLRAPEWSPSAWLGGNTTGRDGQATGAATSNSSSILTVAPATTTVIVGFAVFSTSYTTPNPFCQVSNGSGLQLSVVLNASGFVEIRRGGTGGTLLLTSTGHTAIGNSVWRHVAFKIDIQSGATGSASIQVDGVGVGSVSSVQTATASGNATAITFPATSGSFTPWYFDDVYACDTTDGTSTQGRANSDFLGDVRVQVLIPSAAGDTTGWTPSTGSNWAAVDEVPPNTTDYVSASTTGVRDLYNLTDPVGSLGNVFGVRSNYYSSKTDAGATTLKPVIKENSVATVDSGFGLSFGSWLGVFSKFWWVRPSDSAVWSSTDLTNLQIGQEVG